MQYITTQNLCKQYGQGDAAVHALKDINLGIDKGSFVAITGASGSGKSTLLHLLGGIDLPTSGKVFLDGVDLFATGEDELAALRRSMVGFVFQSFNLLPVLTALENILIPIKLGGMAVDEAYLAELVAFLGLSDKMNRLPGQLSGGQQQRVAIARALITRPAIILADEPTGNLDSQNSAEVLKILHACVSRYAQTLVLITHDQSVAAEADRIISMRDGCLEGV